MISNIRDLFHNIIQFGDISNQLTHFLVYIIIWLVVYKFIKAVNDYV